MKKLIKMILLVLIIIIIALPTNSYSWGREGFHHGYYYRGYHHWGYYHGYYPYWFFPHGYIIITLGDVPYYYWGGYYYLYDDPAFVMVTPPVGAVIGTVPDNYEQIIINGQTYYTYNGTYYKKVENGYQIVTPPVIVSTNKAPATKDQGKNINQNTTPESFTVNIPNSKGGYTPVIIKRSGTGFVGPQGEYYKEFPSVAQLKAMYVK